MDGNPQTMGGPQQGNYPQPLPPPGYAPQQYPPPQKNMADMVKNPMYIGIGIATSILLIWLGLLFQALMIGASDSGAMKTYLQVGMIIYNLGMAGLVLTLFFVGLGRHDYPQWVRFALIFGAVLLVLWGFMNMMSLVGYIFKYMGSSGMWIFP